MTDRTKQWIDATKTLGFPITITLMLMACIIVPMFWSYMRVVNETVSTQAKLVTTLERVSTIQDAQTRNLEELTRLTQRSADCLQRVEAALRDVDRRSGAAKLQAINPGT